MITYSSSKLTRNPSAFKDTFKLVNDTTITTKNIRILVPKRFTEGKLAYLNGTSFRTVAIYAILDDNNNYSVIRCPIYHNFESYDITNVMVDDTEFIQVSFLANEIFLISNTMVVTSDFTYDLFEEFFTKGYIPFYMNYEDLSKLFEKGDKYSNVNIGNDPSVFELIASIVARSSKDKKLYYRQVNADGPISYVGLNNIIYGYTNTISRIMGGYMKEGIVTSVVDPETETTALSNMLRR